MTRSLVAGLSLLVATAILGTACQSSVGNRAPEAVAREAAPAPGEAKVAPDDAKAIALAKVPRGRIKKWALEREGGRLIYTFEIVVPGQSGLEEVNIDAIRGDVIEVKHETPKDELREQQQEAREAAERDSSR